MSIFLKKADFDDCAEIQKMQVAAFSKLLEKYQDFSTNPAVEPLETIERKFNQQCTTYYFIMLNDVKIGVIRVVTIDDDTCRVSPIFIIPEFENRGYAQAAMTEAERLYPRVSEWQIETIKQESRLCHLYEKLGYKPTGKEEQIKDGMTIVYYKKSEKTDRGFDK